MKPEGDREHMSGGYRSEDEKEKDQKHKFPINLFPKHEKPEEEQRSTG